MVDSRYRPLPARIGRPTPRGVLVAVGLWIIGGLLLCGCGGGGLTRVPVSGQVTLDGKPLANGSITFIPVGQGITAGGRIVDAHYELSSKDGLVPATYQVRINASEPTGRTIVDPVGNIEIPDMRNVIPPRYNMRTELSAKVTAEGPNRFDYDLKSK